MSALDPRDADRLGKLIALLSSDQVGERAAAAAKASRFLEARDLSWHDIVSMITPTPHVVPASPSRAHRIDARRCLASSTVWKDHESDFLVQMAGQRREPSEKQRGRLDGLLDRASGGDRAA